MPIDITTDLNIDLTVISTETKSITNVYDTGNPPGTYLPGKDFSPTDNVSTGTVTSYQIGISLTSKSNQTYPIDKLFLQSVDDPKTNGTGQIPFYFINTDPNPQNITDDNKYTLVPNYTANMLSVVLDQNSGITSNSTITLTLNVNYPNGLYWKTKIAPKIVAVAEKDLAQKTSNQIKPTEVRMSSTADIENDFYREATEWGGIRLATNGGVKGFYVPFYFKTGETNPANINTLLDSPNATTITYTADLNFTIDGTIIPITQPNITAALYGGTGISIQSATISGSKYTVVLNRTGNISFPILVRTNIFLPYDPGSKNTVTMNMVGTWDTSTGGVEWANWINEYIFTEGTTGGINESQVIPLTFTNPPTLSNDVSSLIQPPNTSISSNFRFSNLNFMSMAGSKMMLLYDSKISYISDAAPFLQVMYIEPGGTNYIKYTPPTTDYIQQYGYANLPVGYNANTVCQSVFNGAVTLGSYQDIVNAGHTPNVLITTFLTNVLENLNIDYSNAVSISYQQADTEIISNTDFLQMYENNPSGNYTSYLYTSMLIGTNFSSVAEANAQYGTSIAPTDQFVNVAGKVYLDLSTTTKGGSAILKRFGIASTVRADINPPSYTTTFQTSITNDNVNTITSIADYTKTYYLRFFVQSPNVNFSVPGTMLAGTKINFAIPANILPYIYLAGVPGVYLLDSASQASTLIDTITNYSLTSGGINITIPNDVTFYNTGAKSVYVNIPVKFISPAQSQLFGHANTTFDLSKLILAYPDQIVTGFSANTAYYKAKMVYVDSTLLGSGVDFTGLTVNKSFYQNGTSVNYIASVKNVSNVNNSIYMALTVPTNKYNPIETSNNTQDAFINGFTTFSPSTVIYYQTAAKATAADINAMKVLNNPGSSLADYYNNVIVTNWTLYNQGDALPNDVVMFVAYTPNIATGVITRVDYSVQVQMDINTTNTYINNAVFNYYSAASTLESQSNEVTIQNYLLANNIIIAKTPQNQTIEGITGSNATFTLKFDVPAIATQYQSLTLTDQLPKSLKLLTSSTLQIGSQAPVPLNASMDANKLVTVYFTDMASIAGKTLIVTLNTSIDQPENIPVSKTDTNQASLIINSDPSLVSKSNVVNISFIYKDLFNINKQPQTQLHPKTQGEKVNFYIYFNVPQDVTNITNMVITDTLAAALAYDPTNSLLQIGNISVEPLNATVTNNTVSIDFTNFASAAGQLVKITLGTILTDITLLPQNGIVNNNAVLNINNIPAYSFTSNTVEAKFGNIVLPIPVTKAPATQTIEAAIGNKVPFELDFTMPQSILDYNSITVTDTLQASLLYSASDSTIQFGANAPVPLNATVSGNTVTVIINNLSGLASETVKIKLVGLVNDLTKIPTSNQITNEATLVVNNDQTLSSRSNVVTVIFTPVVEKNPIKTASTNSFDITKDQIINFEVTFFSKLVQDKKMTILVEDVIDSNLQIVNYSLDIVNTPNITIIDGTTGNDIKYSIATNYPAGSLLKFPETFKLNITAKYVANKITDENYIINNFATVKFGETGNILTSNTVQIEAIGSRKQAIIDVIESVALEQASLSHILNAEGEKLQKMLELPGSSTETLLKTNKSIYSMIRSVSSLEMILEEKLSLFECFYKCN